MAKNENIDLKLNIDSISGLKSVGTMRKELKAMQIELQELETTANKALAMGDEATAAKAKSQHAERTKQFAELKNDLKDTAAAQKYLDPGELLGGYVKLAQGAVGAFGAVTAGLKLMGSENEIVNEITEKSATVIQFMMGLEQARQLLIDAGGVKQIAMLVKTTALQFLQVGATIAQTTATGAATAAQWLLNVAMSMNPIGLVVLAVAGLIAAFYALVESTGSVVEALKWMINPVGMLVVLLYETYEASKVDNTEKERSIAITKEKIKATEKEIDAQNKVITSIEKKIEKMKAQGATEQEIFRETLRLSDQKIKLANLEMKKATEQFELSKKQGELSLVDYIRIENAKRGIREETEAKQKIKDDAEDKRIADARAKAEAAHKKKLDDEKTYTQKIQDLQDDAIKNEFDKNEAKIKRAAQREIEALNKNAKNYKELKEKIEAKRDSDIAANNIERKKSAEETEKEIQDSVYSIILESMNQQLDGIKDSEEKKKLIREISAKEEAKAIAEFEKANEDLKLKDLEAYNKGIANIQNKYAKNIVKSEKEIDEQVLNDKKNIQDKINNLKQLSFNEEIQSIIDSANEEIRIEEEKWGKLKENEAKFLEWKELKNQETTKKIADEKQKRFEEEVGTTTEIINKINDLFNQASEEKLARLEDQYSREEEQLQNKLDKGLITQEQFDKQSEKLEKEKNEKIRVEKEKAWKRQHAVDIANAIANAAIAVSQVFAAEPGELTIKSLAAATAAAIAAGQVALIASQKMPKFEKGGFIGGRSHSMGGTLIEAEAGEFIVNKKSMSNPGFASIVSSINNAGNSAQVPNISSFTGNNTSTIVSTLDPSVIDQIVSRIVNIPVNVVESDITQTQRKVSTIESRSVI